ncbi:hypothetical protein R3I94_020689 [Phoxinus phoxinus]
MTSPSPRTICFVYFALLFGTENANTTDIPSTTSSVTQGTSEDVTSEIVTQTNLTKTKSKSDNISKSTNPSVSTKPASVDCTPATSKGQCIFFLPTGDILELIVVALIVGCFSLLLTTLICICQICHLRGIISSLQHCQNNNIDLRAIREKSESPNRDEGREDGQPTETCLMLSEVITAQEESREDEERVLENKTEENKDTVKDPNGDITQENSHHEPEAKAPESSDTGV